MLYTTLLRQLFRAVYGEPADQSSQPESPLVLVADGVGGLDLCATGLRHLAGSTSPALDVRVIAWGHGFGRWHADLTRTDRHEQQAEHVAELVRAKREKQPETPVFLVGKSGGTGIIVKALERLDAGSVEAVVLLAPALSPRYDLSRALRSVRREMVVYWSPMDLFVLGAGTWLFKTIDRRRSVSAGLVGFRLPKGLSDQGRREYGKLRQVRWRVAMMPTGYFGGHIGPDTPAFLRKYVLPILHD